MKRLTLILIIGLLTSSFANSKEREVIPAENPFFSISSECRSQLRLLEADDSDDDASTIGIEHSLVELDNMIRIVTNPTEGSALRSKLTDWSFMHYKTVK